MNHVQEVIDLGWATTNAGNRKPAAAVKGERHTRTYRTSSFMVLID